MDSGRAFTTQFVINNLSSDRREFLIKKTVREEISKYADVEIAIRGRYIKPKEDGSLIVGNDRPLHLHISGPTKHSLTLAMKKIQLLLRAAEKNDSGAIDEENTNLEEKISIGIDIFPSTFKIKAKVLGENNENVKYIAKETGAVISLKGKGSGFRDHSTNLESNEPLHMVVKYKNVESRDNARQLLLNLIETVQQDFINTYGKMYRTPNKPEVTLIRPLRENNVKTSPSLKNDNVPDNVKGTIEKIIIGLDRVPPSFNLKSKIYGPNLTNVKHIEKVTNALLLVECGNDKDDTESLESPYILVKYPNREQKDTARNLILNLIETIHQEFIALYGTYPVKPKVPQIIPLKTLSNTTSSSSVSSKFSNATLSINSPKSPRLNILSSTPTFSTKDKSSEPLRSTTQTSTDEPVPPPPPVISKARSPDFIKVSKPDAPKKSGPLYAFCNQKSAVSRSTSIATSINEEPSPDAFNVSARFEMSESIKSIPSIVPSAMISQPAVPNTPLPAYQPNPIADPVPFYRGDGFSNRNQNSQYFKKKSNSSVETFSEGKNFCNRPGIDTPPHLGHITSISGNQREPTVSKVKNSANRYLVPLQEINTITTVTHNPVPAVKTVTTTERSTATEVKKLTRTPQQALPASGEQYQKNEEEKNHTFLNGGRKRSKNVAFSNRLSYYVEDPEDDDQESIILIDSDDDVDAFENSRVAISKNKGVAISKNKDAKKPKLNTCSTSVQTDDYLFELDMKNIECACGRFSRVVTRVRSWGTQTSNLARRH